MVLNIVDNKNHNVKKNELVVFFNHFDDRYKNQLHLMDEFVKQQEELKIKLLNFIDNIFYKLKNQKEFKYLLSFLVFEKSPNKTQYMYLFYKTNIIIKYIKENKISQLNLFIEDKNILSFFISYAKQNNIKYKIKQISKTKINKRKLAMQNNLLSYGYKFYKELSKISYKIKKNSLKHKKLVVSYYPNYYLKDKNFYSKYFMELSEKLNQEYDWLFLYVGDIRKLPKENEILSNYNLNYNFLDSFISYKDLFDVFVKHQKLFRQFKKIDLKDLFVFEDIDYFDIMIDDWKISLSANLIDLLIFETKFNNFFKNYNYEEVLYLMEYHPWEQVLNKVIHKKNIFSKGISHSIIRPNLLNYFYPKNLHNNMDVADIVGANSEFAKKVFLDNGFKENQVFEIEAQRFLYLKNTINSNKKTNNLLISTSIIFQETKEFLEVFSMAYEKGLFNKIYIKPHPYLEVKNIIKQIPNFPNHKILKTSMKEAFELVDVVYVTNGSSVLLESILNNKQTITLFSLTSFPMPAINKHNLLHIVTSSKELNKKLKDIKNQTKNVTNKTYNLLYLDNNFKLWNKFIDYKKDIK